MLFAGLRIDGGEYVRSKERKTAKVRILKGGFACPARVSFWSSSSFFFPSRRLYYCHRKSLKTLTGMCPCGFSACACVKCVRVWQCLCWPSADRQMKESHKDTLYLQVCLEFYGFVLEDSCTRFQCDLTRTAICRPPRVLWSNIPS